MELNSYNYTEDLQYSKDICREYKPALKLMLTDFSDHLFYISNKFVNTRNYSDGWDYTTEKGYKIKVTDEVSDTYLWLIKQLILKSCKFLGKNNASLSTYLNSILNNSFTFKDWLKWKYGNINYIPKCLSNYSKSHIEIFKLLKRKIPVETISIKINLEEEDVEEKILEIKSVLLKNNITYLINTPIIESLLLSDNDDEIEFDIKDTTELDLEKKEETSVIRSMLRDGLDALEKSEKRLLMLYWADGLSTNQILTYVNNETDLKDYKNHELNDKNAVYAKINVIINILLDWIKSNHLNIFEEYQINSSILRRTIKIYLENFSL